MVQFTNRKATDDATDNQGRPKAKKKKKQSQNHVVVGCVVAAVIFHKSLIHKFNCRRNVVVVT
jgi:hypothetical protein